MANAVYEGGAPAGAGDSTRDLERVQDEERGVTVRVGGTRDAEHGYVEVHRVPRWVFAIVRDVIQYCNACMYVTEDADGAKCY